MSKKSLAEIARRERGRTLSARRIFQWFFRDRKTGEITIAQAPNLVLWIVIVTGSLLWVWPTAGNVSVVLMAVFKVSLLIWAADEIVRGVNPWRRCLGAAVAIYELTTIL